MLADLFALLLVWFASVGLRHVFGGDFDFSRYWHLAPCLALFPIAYAAIGLYPGILLSPPEELKKITQGTSVIFLVLAGAVFLSKQGDLYSRGIFVMGWLGSLAALPAFRSSVRRIAQGKKWWGYPVVIFGAGELGRAVASALAREHRFCLKPVAFFDEAPDLQGARVEGVPVLGGVKDAEELVKNCPGTVAIVAMPGVKPDSLAGILEGPVSEFRRVILIPDLFGTSSLWVSAFDLGGIVGLEVHQKLLDPRREWIKRFVELGLIVLGLPLILFLGAIIAVLIKHDSPGPILYRQQRIGRGGKDITIWKFRTMITDAAADLQECLSTNPELRAEWEESHKLANDPRITRVGRILRKTSLDELPQLWNVIRGDLSLVGPRPIVWDEVEKYRDGFRLYKKVKPGLTGLWQISGRSDTSYAERVRLDEYYVRNWSLWFDIYILLKTPSEVFRCRGAC